MHPNISIALSAITTDGQKQTDYDQLTDGTLRHPGVDR